MKNRFIVLHIVLFPILCLATSTPIFSQSDENLSVLWEFYKEKDSKPSYLLGITHAYCKEKLNNLSLTEYLSQVNSLVFESENNALNKKKYWELITLPDNKTLENFLSPKEIDTLKAALKKAKISYTRHKTLYPIWIDLFLQNAMVLPECKDYYYPEVELEEYAELHGKTRIYLESHINNIQALNFIPISKQKETLFNHIKDDYKQLSLVSKEIDNIKDIRRMCNYTDSINRIENGDDYSRYLLETRNKSWVNKVKVLTESAPIFMVVGGAHLGCDYGLLALLRAEGYIVRPTNFILNFMNKAN